MPGFKGFEFAKQGIINADIGFANRADRVADVPDRIDGAALDPVMQFSLVPCEFMPEPCRSFGG